MAILLLTASSLLFYSGSRHFPFSISAKLSGLKFIPELSGAVTFILGVVALSRFMDATTAIIVGLVSLMTLLPLLIFSLSLYPKSWIGWAIVVSIITLIDLSSYAG